jgi:hypothetical protein
MMNAPACRPCRTAATRCLLSLLALGLAACGGESDSTDEAPQHATEDALAATDAGNATTADTARAPADTAGPAGTWTRADTAAAVSPSSDTAAATAASDTAADGGASAADDPTYATYQNDKFGFSVRYPQNVLQPASDVGDGNGRTFEAPDGSASMLVYATEGTPPEKLQQRFEEQTANPDLEITYQTRGDGWYVLSGYRGDHIFYERVEARDETFKVVRLFYDRSRKRAFDPIVREVSASLQG